MRTRRLKLICLCVLTVGALGVIWAVATGSPPVSMKILGFTAKRWPADIAQQMDSPEYVVAIIAFSNASSRTITYWARSLPDWPEHTLLFQSPMGWKEPPQGFV